MSTRTFTQQPAAKWVSGVLTGAVCTIAVRVQNLSSIEQSGTVTFGKPSLVFNLFVLNPSGMSAWDTAPAPGSGGWFTQSVGGSAVTKAFSINPKARKEIRLTTKCFSKKNGGTTCEIEPASMAGAPDTFGTPRTSPSYPDCNVENAICGVDAGMSVEARIDVTEDRGAVSAVLLGDCSLHNATQDINRQELFYVLNGGRAF